MTKVILIAAVSLLAVVRVAGGPRLADATDFRWTKSTAGIVQAASGGFVAQEFKALFPNSARDCTPALPFASLVSVNRLDAVERPFGGQLTLARVEREASRARMETWPLQRPSDGAQVWLTRKQQPWARPAFLSGRRVPSGGIPTSVPDGRTRMARPVVERRSAGKENNYECVNTMESIEGNVGMESVP